MKNIFNIIIILFVIFSFYIIKDDILILYNKTLVFVKDNISYTRDLYIKEIDKIKNKKLEKSSNNDSTYTNISNLDLNNLPGPLDVSSNLLYLNSKETNLNREKVIEETNLSRKENGDLIPLKVNEKLNITAKEKLDDMFNNNYFEHVSPKGISVSDLTNDTQYEYIIVGENLAMGNFKNEKALLTAWMGSPGHRANILNDKYTEIGVAVGSGKYNGKNVWIAVQHFGTPKSVCNSPDELVHNFIVIKQDEAEKIEQDLLNRKAIIDKRVVFEGKTKNEQITEYNDIVNNYNQMISDLKIKISKYNEEVNHFNDCVKRYTNDSSEE